MNPVTADGLPEDGRLGSSPLTPVRNRYASSRKKARKARSQ
jgi:hypothetical protein